MGKKPRRRRLYFPKKGRPVSRNYDKPGDPPVEATDQECPSTSSSTQILPATSLPGTDSNSDLTETATCLQESVTGSITHGVDHDYGICKSPAPLVSAAPNSSDVEHNVHPTCDKLPSPVAPVELLMTIKTQLDTLLPHLWNSYIESNSINVMCMSPGPNAVTQRNLVFSMCGNVELYVHCKKIDIDPYMAECGPFVPLELGTVTEFVERALQVVENVKRMQVCCGYDEDKYEDVWSICPFGTVDKNPYRECRYVETFRSFSCPILIPSSKWRCEECVKMYKPLKRRSCTTAVERPNSYTANKHYTEIQILQKLKEQARQIKSANSKLSHLKANMQSLILKNGVQIEESMSDDLTKLLETGNMTPAQAIFLQQQFKASQTSNMVGMKWHPTMIRLALAVHLTSPAAYNLMRETGMVQLPSSRTLFDYSHVKATEEGIDQYVLDSLGLRVSKFEERHEKYHVLMADEIYISQNLVFDKHSGKVIGYTSLDTLDAEVKKFEHYMDNPEKEEEAKIASKILVYMVKGVSNGLKEVVASYAVGTPSVPQMYDWTWRVIRALESSNVRVIAFVSDGFSTNRAFIRMHKPATPCNNGVVFDTVNCAARSRNIYFIADVPHLLKTIRNCLLNSRWDGLKSRRHMLKNGKKISWDFIIRLYNATKSKSLRKAFKLNAMNVFPDSYGRMKVKYAAEVISRTVAQAMEDNKWDDASETIAFLRLVNDWFDCLNGAHSCVGKKKRNPRLNPYTSESDPRFEFFQQFLSYIEEWKSECESGNAGLNNTSVAPDISAVGPGGMGDSAIDEGCANEEADTPFSKRMLSKPTLEGIEMTTRAFPLMVKFLLTEGTNFINARVFTQDPLEQHFSKVRAGQGGSNNPNVYQMLSRNRTIHTVGQLGMRKRKGNSGESGECVIVTSEPLPKRKSTQRNKFDLD